MKAVKVSLLSFPFVILLLGLLGFAWWQKQLTPVGDGHNNVDVVVTPAEPGNLVLRDLKDKGLIRSLLAAKIYLRLNDLDTKFVSGNFSLSSDQSTSELLAMLTHGPEDIRVTIPEGWRREQVAERLTDNLSPDFFVAGDFLRLTQGLEGQLFPDTYFFPQNASASDVLKIMTDTFGKKAGINPATQRDELILASLVEREGKTDADRPIIAAVLKKRLNEGMPLQVDATIQYAIGTAKDWWPKNIHTDTPSLYNTYIHPGLPPAPVASPGSAAIKAVLGAKDTPYWFYIHGTDGQVHFATTLAEHNLNVDKYLKP